MWERTQLRSLRRIESNNNVEAEAQGGSVDLFRVY